ncbi:MAG TPA: hypothetical protein VJT33_14585 [bacterium]|nr:hypothetical protein [bacterium]
MLHWSTIEFLAKDRLAEYQREQRKFALVEDAERAAGRDGGLLRRLPAALGRRIALARAGKPAFGETPN